LNILAEKELKELRDKVYLLPGFLLFLTLILNREFDQQLNTNKKLSKYIFLLDTIFPLKIRVLSTNK